MHLKPQTLTAVVPGAEGAQEQQTVLSLGGALGAPTPEPASSPPWCPGCSVSVCPRGDVEAGRPPPAGAGPCLGGQRRDVLGAGRPQRLTWENAGRAIKLIPVSLLGS